MSPISRAPCRKEGINQQYNNYELGLPLWRALNIHTEIQRNTECETEAIEDGHFSHTSKIACSK